MKIKEKKNKLYLGRKDRKQKKQEMMFWLTAECHCHVFILPIVKYLLQNVSYV